MNIIYLGPLFLCFLCILIKLLSKLWWTPLGLQKLMASQGIKGPSYRFFHGNAKEIIRMKHEAIITPMELSDHNILARTEPHLYSWTKLYGMNFNHWIGPQAVLVVTDPELAKMILNNRDGAFVKPDQLGYGRKLFGYGLVTSDGEKWQKNRKLANHVFNAESPKAAFGDGMAPAMVASVEMMLLKWRNHAGGNEIEVFQEFKRLTSEVISRTAFGSSYLDGENIFNLLTQLAPISYRNVLKVRIPGIGKIWKTRDGVESDRLEQEIRDAIIKVVSKREEMVRSGESESFGNDFLGSLVNAYRSNDDSKKISLDDVIDECKTFYIAGQETSSTVLSWTVFLLAIHTDWRDKARTEVVELFGKGNPTPNGIARLTKMGMIINESMRLYPSLVNIDRKVARELRLGGLVFPANIRVSIIAPALPNNPKIWGEDAHKFKPERFAEGVAKATNNNSAAFIPFGYGPRACVGLSFATHEFKIAFSMILQRYRFTLSPNYVHSPAQLLSVYPQHGLQIILHPL